MRLTCIEALQHSAVLTVCRCAGFTDPGRRQRSLRLVGRRRAQNVWDSVEDASKEVAAVPLTAPAVEGRVTHDHVLTRPALLDAVGVADTRPQAVHNRISVSDDEITLDVEACQDDIPGVPGETLSSVWFHIQDRVNAFGTSLVG